MSLVGRGHCCIRKVTRPCTQADVLSSSEAGRMRLISEMLSGSGAILGTSTRGRTGDGGRALSMMSAMACSLAGSGASGGDTSERACLRLLGRANAYKRAFVCFASDHNRRRPPPRPRRRRRHRSGQRSRHARHLSLPTSASTVVGAYPLFFAPQFDSSSFSLARLGVNGICLARASTAPGALLVAAVSP